MLPLGGSLGEYSLNDLEEQPEREVRKIVRHINVVFKSYITLWEVMQFGGCWGL